LPSHRSTNGCAGAVFVVVADWPTAMQKSGAVHEISVNELMFRSPRLALRKVDHFEPFHCKMSGVLGCATPSSVVDDPTTKQSDGLTQLTLEKKYTRLVAAAPDGADPTTPHTSTNASTSAPTGRRDLRSCVRIGLRTAPSVASPSGHQYAARAPFKQREGRRDAETG
jgi:hypothetical protein